MTQASDANLQSFASAVMAVNAIVERWRPQIEGASSEADKQQMAEQANREMRDAIEGVEGMSVDEYQAIAQAAQGDPRLMARVDRLFRKMAPAAKYSGGASSATAIPRSATTARRH